MASNLSLLPSWSTLFGFPIRAGHRRIAYFAAILASLSQPALVAGQGKISTLMIVTEKVPSTVTEAQILVNEESARVKVGTSWPVPNWVPYEGVDVTDQIAPPQGFQIKPTTIKWSSIKQIDFQGCDRKGNCKGTIVNANGQSREVFVWRDSFLSMRGGLAPDHIRVVGRMLIDGEVRDVEFQGTDFWLRLIIPR